MYHYAYVSIVPLSETLTAARAPLTADRVHRAPRGGTGTCELRSRQVPKKKDKKQISRPGFEPGTVRILYMSQCDNNYNLTLYQLSYREYQKVKDYSCLLVYESSVYVRTYRHCRKRPEPLMQRSDIDVPETSFAQPFV